MLQDEILLDFEPGHAASVLTRLEAYIIADDVQLVDASDAYDLLSVQGPRSGEVISKIGLPVEIPRGEYYHTIFKDETLGEIYLANHARFGTQGFDLFVPNQSLGAVFDKLAAACGEVGGGLCGWEAMETARIEAGIPRYGMDMDESNLAPETGIEGRAISYSKGCYIGQEVIVRIRTYGKVAKNLRGLILEDGLGALPVKGTKILHDGKEVGHITSAVKSPLLNKNIALGYVRKEVNQAGTKLSLDLTGGEGSAVEVVDLPFLNRSAAP